jgi:hypothetical protein
MVQQRLAEVEKALEIKKGPRQGGPPAGPPSARYFFDQNPGSVALTSADT